MNSTLPPSAGLNVSALSRIFDDTTNSYKLLFFQALLKLMQRSTVGGEQCFIGLRDICVEMIVIAWLPHSFFKLSLGRQDKVGEILGALDFGSGKQNGGGHLHESVIRDIVHDQFDRIGASRLLRYVPYRLLHPFFAKALRGVPEHRRNVFVQQLAQETFESGEPPLYRFVDFDNGIVEIHPAWAKYLSTSMSLVRGWAQFHWINYLQARNSSVPAVSSKIAPLMRRRSLAVQTEYWRVVRKRPAITLLFG